MGGKRGGRNRALFQGEERFGGEWSDEPNLSPQGLS